MTPAGCRRRNRLLFLLQRGLILAGLCLAIQPLARAAANRDFENDDQKYLYYWGTTFGQQLEAAGIKDPKDIQSVLQGLQEQASGVSPEFGQEYPSLLNNYLVRRSQAAAEAEAEVSRNFVKTMGAETDAVTTDSGLVIRELVRGTGAQPTRQSRVTVNYTGTLRDGKVFDSSVARGQPLETRLDKVIACWSEALPMMRVGGKARITCPPDLAYGSKGNRGIPGGAALNFEVDLLEVSE